MSNIFLLHDLDDGQANRVRSKFPANALVFSATPMLQNCVGCFGCWTKTPGQCVIRDRGQLLPKFWASCNQIVIVSRLLYGGFSPEIKACMERSLGYILPYFRIVNREMHHKMRYNNPFHLAVHFYSENCSIEEKKVATYLVKANALNFGAGDSSVTFHQSMEEVSEVFL